MSVTEIDDETRTILFHMGTQDAPRPEEDYFEVVDAFIEATKIAGFLIIDCMRLRHMPG